MAEFADIAPFADAIIATPQDDFERLRRKRLAKALASGSGKPSYEPIKSPWQGASRLVDGFAHGLGEGMQEKLENEKLAEEQAGVASATKDTDEFLSGSATAPQVSTSISPAVEMTGGNRGGGKFDVGKAYSLMKSVGANDEEARVLAAISQPESAGNPGAYNPNGADKSYGLWQINMLGGLGPERRAKFGLTRNEDLYDPATNARAALQLARSRGGYGDWTTYTSGKYKPYLPKTADIGGDGSPDRRSILAAGLARSAPSSAPSETGFSEISGNPEDLPDSLRPRDTPLPERRPAPEQLAAALAAPRVIPAPADVPRAATQGPPGLPAAPPGTHYARGPGAPLLLRDSEDAATAGGAGNLLAALAGAFGLGSPRIPQAPAINAAVPAAEPQADGVQAAGPASGGGAPAAGSDRLRALGRVLQNPYASPQIKSLAMEEYKRLTTPVAPREPKRQVVQLPDGRQVVIDLETGQPIAQPLGEPKVEKPTGPVTLRPGEALVDPKTGAPIGDPRPSEPKGPEAEAAARKRLIESQGGDPTETRNRDFILTGKFPREDATPLTATDKKAILEADEMVMSNEAVLRALDEAKKVSPKAFGFPGANIISTPLSIIGDESSRATQDLDNLVTSQALAGLKSIFGAAPTEGERRILLDIQGSTAKPDAVRQKIYDRAIVAAQKRLEFNKQRSGELRGGDFYKPKESSPASADVVPTVPAEKKRLRYDPATGEFK